MSLITCNAARETAPRLIRWFAVANGTELTLTEERLMNRTFALLTSAAVTLTSLAMAPNANAAIRYRSHDGYYNAAPRFHESPTYAPDRPAPRHYDNPGRPDFQDGSRG